MGRGKEHKAREVKSTATKSKEHAVTASVPSARAFLMVSCAVPQPRLDPRCTARGQSYFRGGAIRQNRFHLPQLFSSSLSLPAPITRTFRGEERTDCIHRSLSLRFEKTGGVYCSYGEEKRKKRKRCGSRESGHASVRGFEGQCLPSSPRQPRERKERARRDHCAAVTGVDEVVVDVVVAGVVLRW